MGDAPIAYLPHADALMKFFEAWCICRLSEGLPLVLWGVGGVPGFLPRCPCCQGSLVGLVHILSHCPRTAEFREDLPAEARPNLVRWAFGGEAEVGRLRAKIRFVGLCLATVAGAMQEEFDKGRKRSWGVASI